MTSLEREVTKTVLRCTSRVCRGWDVKNILSVVDALTPHVLNMVLLSGTEATVEVHADRYAVWIIMNQIVDEVAKEIPAADQIEIIGHNIRRFDRIDYERLKKEHWDDAATADGNQGGRTQDMDA